jgi:alpha-L-fucosidase 2
MRQIIRLTSCALFAMFGSGVRADDVSLMWYDKPAADWEKEALPLGNGRIGAMVFGGIETERLQISEKSLWTGGPGSEGGYDYGLPADSQEQLTRSIGKQLADGAQLKPEDVARQLGRKMRNYGDYQSFGDLYIERGPQAEPVTGYRRELDLDTAISRVSFKQGGVGYRREYFVSYPGQVLIARWYSTSTQKLRIRYAVPDNRSALVKVDAQGLSVSGALKSNGLAYAAYVRVIPDCGTAVPDGDALRIETECAITFILAARTNYQMKYPAYRTASADYPQFWRVLDGLASKSVPSTAAWHSVAPTAAVQH